MPEVYELVEKQIPRPTRTCRSGQAAQIHQPLQGFDPDDDELTRTPSCAGLRGETL